MGSGGGGKKKIKSKMKVTKESIPTTPDDVDNSSVEGQKKSKKKGQSRNHSTASKINSKNTS